MTTDLPFRVLLNWAVDYITLDVASMRRCYCDRNGNFEDEDVALEIHDAERWLAEAREALK